MNSKEVILFSDATGYLLPAGSPSQTAHCMLQTCCMLFAGA